MKKLISSLILIAFLIFFSSHSESSPVHDDESNLFMDFDNNMLPLIISSHSSHEDGKYTISTRPRYPKHPKHPKRPIHRRAYVYFPSPPDIAAGVIVFWETHRNTTLIYGQFSKGFVEGKEKNYSFKVYKDNQEIYDLKPKDENLDRIFKIKSNGATDPFLFAVNGTLVSEEGVIDSDFVISKPDALIGKDKIKPLPC